ncbi:MAG: MerR family transcriptional regulator [Fusobacteriaceae bacterium]
MYSIKAVSEKVGISSHTIRYYEKYGLLPYVPRNVNGIRTFSQDDIFWLEIIKCLKNTGMTIENIKGIVDLSLKGNETKEERKTILFNHRKKILEQIKELKNNLKKIDLKIAWYEDDSNFL